MSSFAKASFDVAGYLASRPSYPPRIIDILLAYHLSPTASSTTPPPLSLTQGDVSSSHTTAPLHINKPAPSPAGRLERAIDVGCGPGFLALSLAKHFDDVLALDPAEKMVRIGLQPGSDAAAQFPSEDGVNGESIEGQCKDKAVGGKGCREIRYKVGTAERLGEAGVGEGEEGVDLVIAGGPADAAQAKQRIGLIMLLPGKSWPSGSAQAAPSHTSYVAHPSAPPRAVTHLSIPALRTAPMSEVLSSPVCPTTPLTSRPHRASSSPQTLRPRRRSRANKKGYGELIFPSHPHLSSLVSKHSQFFWSGGHWQAGRAIVEGLLDDVPFPVSPAALSSPEATGSREELLRGLPPLAEGLGHPVSDKVFQGRDLGDNGEINGLGAEEWDAGSAVRLKWDTTTAAPGSALNSALNDFPSSSSSASAASHSPQADGIKGNNSTERHQWLMRKTFTRASLEGYFRTWSALHAYHEAHPEDAALRLKGGATGTEEETAGQGEGEGKGQGDIVDRLMRDIWAGRAESAEQVVSQSGSAGAKEEEIEGAWPLVLMMIKKKA